MVLLLLSMLLFILFAVLDADDSYNFILAIVAAVVFDVLVIFVAVHGRFF